jgi:hypothetical protein
LFTIPEYKAWLEEILKQLESEGHTVFCALRADQYKINDTDPAAAFSLDLEHIQASDVLLALLGDKPSVGVQTEIGVAVGLGRRVILAHKPEEKLAYFNAAMLRAGVVQDTTLPLDQKALQLISGGKS